MKPWDNPQVLARLLQMGVVDFEDSQIANQLAQADALRNASSDNPYAHGDAAKAGWGGAALYGLGNAIDKVSGAWQARALRQRQNEILGKRQEAAGMVGEALTGWGPVEAPPLVTAPDLRKQDNEMRLAAFRDTASPVPPLPYEAPPPVPQYDTNPDAPLEGPGAGMKGDIYGPETILASPSQMAQAEILRQPSQAQGIMGTPLMPDFSSNFVPSAPADVERPLPVPAVPQRKLTPDEINEAARIKRRQGAVYTDPPGTWDVR